MRMVLDVFIANGLAEGRNRKDATRGHWANMTDQTADSVGFIRGRTSWRSDYHVTAYQVTGWVRNESGRIDFDVVDVTDEAVIRCLYDMPVLSPSGARDWRISGDLDEWLAARA